MNLIWICAACLLNSNVLGIEALSNREQSDGKTCPRECASSSDEGVKRRLRLALELKDFRTAHALLGEMNLSPDIASWTPEHVSLLFEIYARSHDLDGMSRLWEIIKRKESYHISEAVLEQIAWSIIETASLSHYPKHRFEALISGAMSNDGRGIAVLHRLMLDSHEALAQEALGLAPFFLDECIQQRAIEILCCDTPPYKMAAARILSQQKIPHVEELLSPLMHDEDLSEDDRIEVAALIAQGVKKLDQHQLNTYREHSQSAIRALAASYVMENPSKENLISILPLLNDPSNGVKRISIATIGLWQQCIPETIPSILIQFRNALQFFDASVGATAAFALLISPDQSGQEEACAWFERTILSSPAQTALIATSRLIRCGSSATPLLKRLLTAPKVDPLCRLNIAVALLEQRESCVEANEIIKAFSPSQLLAEQQEGIFSWIVKSPIRHDPEQLRAPESVNCQVRLKLIALRAYAGMQIDGSELEQLFLERSWGISVGAIEFAFAEYGASIDQLIRPLLEHTSETVRIQAALIYAIVRKSADAATLLASEYERASKEGKELLVLGYGALLPSYSIPHLTPLLFSPSLSIRTRAAGALIQSLLL